MQTQNSSHTSPVFGLAFITAIFAITFFLTRPVQTLLNSETLLSADELSILYLADETQIPVDSYRHPDILLRELSRNIHVINHQTGARAALDKTALKDLHVLIVDQSALSFVNTEDIANAYDESVVIFVLNILVTQFSELIDDARITFDNFAADPYPGDFFIYTQRPPNGYARGQNNLDTPRDFEILAAVLTVRGTERRCELLNSGRLDCP
jgi:hypothetical protein